jgi:type I restriction enzyme S subunit
MITTTQEKKIPEGYKQTEVGVIPSDWDTKEIGNVAISIASGRSNTHSEIGDYPIYGSTGIIGYKKHKDYQGDKILVARVGANAGTVNKVSGEYCVSDNTLMITYPDEVDIDFSYYQLINYRLNRMVFGSGQPLITGSQLKKLTIPLPRTKSEQAAIATVLSDAESLIDGLEKLIAKKRAIKQGAMQELLTGKRRLPGFKGRWEERTIGDLFNLSGGYAASRDRLTVEGLCYLHYGDIHGSVKTYVDTRADIQDIAKLDISPMEISPSSLLEDGDVVFADASEGVEGIGNYVVVVNKDNIPFISGLHTIVAKSKNDELCNEYRRYCFRTAAIHQQFLLYAVSTTVSGISKTNVSKLRFPIPPVPEQSAIATILSDMDSEIEVLEQKLTKYKLIKIGMMQQLLTGKIRLK